MEDPRPEDPRLGDPRLGDPRLEDHRVGQYLEDRPVPQPGHQSGEDRDLRLETPHDLAREGVHEEALTRAIPAL